MEQGPLNRLPASEEAAVWAYRLILGREPESSEIVRDHARCSVSVAELRERFLESSEFTQRYRAVERERGRNVSVFPPCAIQTHVDGLMFARLLQHLARSWNHFGEAEPYWSVMSEPQYVMDRIGETREAFLDSGRENVERLLATLLRNNVALDPQWDVLELGCGLGRSTRWLAPLFRKVFAVDISVSHLELAHEINAGAPRVERIEWMRLPDPASLDLLPEFDLFFSMIVLQHNPPPIIGILLEKVAEKLRPGGIAFFQVPTYQRGYSFDAETYLRLHADTREIEMHAFPQSEVFRIFRERGCIPLEVFEDGLSGHRDNHRSNSFLFRKLLPEEVLDDPAGTQLLNDLRAQLAAVHVRAQREHEAGQQALADASRHAQFLEAELERVRREAECEYELGQKALSEASRHATVLQAELDRVCEHARSDHDAAQNALADATSHAAALERDRAALHIENQQLRERVLLNTPLEQHEQQSNQ